MNLGGGKHTYLSAQREWERSVMRNFFLANPPRKRPTAYEMARLTHQTVSSCTKQTTAGREGTRIYRSQSPSSELLGSSEQNRTWNLHKRRKRVHVWTGSFGAVSELL